MGQITDLEQFKRGVKNNPKPETIELPDVLKTDSHSTNGSPSQQSHSQQSTAHDALDGEIVTPTGAHDPINSLVPLHGDILPPTEQPKSNIPASLTGIDLTKTMTRAELIFALQNNIPRNEYNLPRYLYRTDLLDPGIFHLTEQEQQEIDNGENDKYQIMQASLDAAVLELTYQEGFPAFRATGAAIWSKLDFESPEDHDLFESYRSLPGARQLELLPAQHKKRTIVLFHTNYWAVRTLASDAFASVHMRRMREQRILKTDDAHFLMSERLITKLKDVESGVNWDVLKENPQEFVQTLERVAKLQRQSLGLVSANGSGGKAPEGVESVQSAMRRSLEQPVQSEATSAPEAADILKLLGDDKLAGMAQEVILRVQRKPRT
jgi:hypothetical protein